MSSNLVSRLAVPALFRRSDVTEHRQQSQVVGNFQHTAYDERPAEARYCDEEACNNRTQRRSQAPWDRSKARGGGPLLAQLRHPALGNAWPLLAWKADVRVRLPLPIYKFTP